MCDKTEKWAGEIGATLLALLVAHPAIADTIDPDIYRQGDYDAVQLATTASGALTYSVINTTGSGDDFEIVFPAPPAPKKKGS